MANRCSEHFFLFTHEETKEANSHEDATVLNHSPLQKQEGWQWWLLVSVGITFLLSGQSMGTLLGNFYYDQGGDSKWLATLVQSAAFPIVFVPLLFFPSSPSTATTANTTSPSIAALAFLYTSLGLLIDGDNLMYSCGLLYLPVSTSFSHLCNSTAFQRPLFLLYQLTKVYFFILNSLVILTLSASLLQSTRILRNPIENPSENTSLDSFSLWVHLPHIPCI